MGKNVVIRHFIKKSNITYLYWGHSYYSPEHKCTKNIKKCIGKMNERNEFVPNKTFLSLPADEQLATGLTDRPFLVTTVSPSEEDDITAVVSRTKFYGWVAVIERIATDEHLTESLRLVFPSHYTILMNLMESSLTVNSTMYNTRKFHSAYWDFARKLISKGEVDSALKEADLMKEKFFEIFEKTRPTIARYSVCAVDSTSYSTYSSLLELARYGHNKEHDALEQINILVVCEEETGVPLLYRSVQGNVIDKTSLVSTLSQMRNAKFRKEIILVMDRGFWSQENISHLVSSNFAFIMCLPSNNTLFRQTVENVRKELTLTANYIPEIKRSCVIVPHTIEATRRGTDKPKEMALYVYCDQNSVSIHTDAARMKFVMKLKELRNNHNLWNSKENSFTGKYFCPVFDDDGKIVDFCHNEQAQAEYIDNCGIYICLAPKGMDPATVHRNYKHRQRIEDGFGASKERDRRLRASDNSNLEGYVFIDFLNSIIDSALRYRMKDYALDRTYTLDQLEDIVSSARYYVPQGELFENGKWIDLTKEQKTVLYSMGLTEMEDLYPGTAQLAENEKQRRLGIPLRRGRRLKSVGVS